MPLLASSSLALSFLASARPMPRITPGDTGNSWLYHKINDQPPAVGLPMPAPETGNALSAIDKDIITTWILTNAPNN